MGRIGSASNAIVQQALDLDSKNTERASLVHEYWKRWYAGKFKKRGYRVYLEVPRRSGKVDVVARKGAENIAIEIETGKSDVVWNVRQDLLSGYSKVLIIATDGKALKKVEQKLAHAGLIIPNRVEVVLRDRSRFNPSPTSKNQKT